jgi:triacylglycerol esterase/lipase EstA (alpha/beta hydrolase family)
MLHRIYLSPGMFGFGRLASYDYFGHLERALSTSLRNAGEDVEVHVVHVAPTASIRRRALKLTELVATTCDASNPHAGPIHLVGHSTGGLDARLVASPSVSLSAGFETLAWRSRIASVTTINAPHFGTPLASFFTTASGQRVLRALTALTIIALTVGSPPLSAVSALVAAFGRVDRALGLELKILDRTTDALLQGIDEVRSREIRDYLDAINEDNGAMVQLMPEAMDLFIAGVEDKPNTLYQSTASMAPSPSLRTFVGALRGPWSALSAAIFAIMYGISSRYDRRYPCAAPDAGAENERTLAHAFGRRPGARANDGVVPIRSQIWGKLVWAGYADHLDVLGHFAGKSPGEGDAGNGARRAHVDWLRSGSDFHRGRFESLVSAIARGLLSSGREAERRMSHTSA